MILSGTVLLLLSLFFSSFDGVMGQYSVNVGEQCVLPGFLQAYPSTPHYHDEFIKNISNVGMHNH